MFYLTETQNPGKVFLSIQVVSFKNFKCELNFVGVKWPFVKARVNYICPGGRNKGISFRYLLEMCKSVGALIFPRFFSSWYFQGDTILNLI